jgi:prepilin-type processing-associated H-X9-DG protein
MKNRNIQEESGMKKKRLPVVEILVIVVILGILTAILLDAYLKARESARRSACVVNLKQIGSALYTYSKENDGKYPPVNITKNNFILKSGSLYPKYLVDASLFGCPSDPDIDPNASFRLLSTVHHPGFSAGAVHPDCITDKNYVYLGWVVMSDEEAEAFFEAYDMLSPEDYDKDITVPEGRGNEKGPVLHRFSADVDELIIFKRMFMWSGPATSSLIPIMWEKPSTDPKNFTHKPPGKPGGNVLYLDGHVEFVRYGEKFPMTETMARLLEERPREPIPDCEE